MARKIALNSAYGAIGNKYCRYYDVRQAEGITLAGQFSIRFIQRRVNEYLNNLLKTEKKIMLLLQIQIQSIFAWGLL